ncbi:DUF2634 domain-containing protein [uncultured Fusobacterium sp.]|uniref:DUF2634 domain-containing protein n=1 Tax=uncultured Fusobacterium sp. TaxID=159267 RepID=UPI0025E4F9E0|nr:DUF2634 domain-containing protein [uncultured Fusobacterium sp.]
MAGFEIFMNSEIETSNVELPLFKEIAIDFETGEPLIKENEFIILEGKEALKVWVWKTLKTDRNRYLIHSESYGNDLSDNIGQIYDKIVKDALMINEIKECLLVNPYITNVYNFDITTLEEGRHPVISFYVDTIYGVVESEVNTNLWTM